MKFTFRSQATLVGIRAAMAMAAVAAVLLPGGTAQAQFGEAAGIADAMQQEYYRRDMRLFEEGLGLDDTQRSVVDSLFVDYEQDFNEGLARMRKRLEDMREQFRPDDLDQVLRLVFQPIEEWSVEKCAMGDVFLENVKVVLTPDQMEMWPKFQRYLFREKNLSKGRLSGESLNLFHIVRDMNLNAPEMIPVQAVLDQYDMALDQALRKRQQALTNSQSEMLRSFAERNPAVSLAILERQVGLQVAVRSVNDTYIGQTAAAMPEARAGEFRQKALERAYPRVYRPTPVQGMFKAARELPGLEASILEAVIALEQAYVSELAALNESLAELVRHSEPHDMRMRAEAFSQRMNNVQPQPIDDPTREPFLRRDEVSRRYARLLQAILTPEQFGQLPGGYRWAENPAEAQEPEAPADPGAGGKRRPPAGGKTPAPDEQAAQAGEPAKAEPSVPQRR